jgi:cytochrome c oxidase subunit 3
MPPVAIEAEELRPAGPGGGGPRNRDPGDPGDRGGGGDGDQGGHLPGAGAFAMRFVLVSITALFITVGIAYFVRSRSPINWQHIAVPRWLWLSTALILGSSWTLETARASFHRRDLARYARWMQITLGLGLAFLASQILALHELVGQGIYLRHNPHSSLFYVVSGLHGLHLLGGMTALCYLLLRASLRPRQRSRLAVSALYWHFLSVLWLALFLCLLLWP